MTDWKTTLSQAFEALEIADIYAEDGAYRTAADCAELAAALFRQAAAERVKAFS